MNGTKLTNLGKGRERQFDVMTAKLMLVKNFEIILYIFFIMINSNKFCKNRNLIFRNSGGYEISQIATIRDLLTVWEMLLYRTSKFYRILSFWY